MPIAKPTPGTRIAVCRDAFERIEFLRCAGAATASSLSRKDVHAREREDERGEHQGTPCHRVEVKIDTAFAATGESAVD